MLSKTPLCKNKQSMKMSEDDCRVGTNGKALIVTEKLKVFLVKKNPPFLQIKKTKKVLKTIIGNNKIQSPNIYIVRIVNFKFTF